MESNKILELQNAIYEKIAVNLSQFFMCSDCPITTTCKCNCLQNWREFINLVMEDDDLVNVITEYIKGDTENGNKIL